MIVLTDAAVDNKFVDDGREVEERGRSVGGEDTYTCPALAVITGASLPRLVN